MSKKLKKAISKFGTGVRSWPGHLVSRNQIQSNPPRIVSVKKLASSAPVKRLAASMASVAAKKPVQTPNIHGIAQYATELLGHHVGQPWGNVFASVTAQLQRVYSQVAWQVIQQEVAKIVLVPAMTVTGMAYHDVNDPITFSHKPLHKAVGSFYIHPISGILFKVQGRYTQHTPEASPVIKLNKNTWQVWDASQGRYLKVVARDKEVTYKSSASIMRRGKLVRTGPMVRELVAPKNTAKLPKGISANLLVGFNPKTQYFHSTQYC